MSKRSWSMICISRRAPRQQSGLVQSGLSQIVAVRTGKPEVTDQMCRSCTAATCSFDSRASRISRKSRCSGVAWIRMATVRRSRPTLLQRIRPPMTRLTSGSAGIQPVCRMIEAGDDRADRAEGVGNHMREGPFDVDVLLAAAQQDPGAGEVGHQARNGDQQHARALDLGRVQKPRDRLADDQTHDQDQHGAVDERADHLGAKESERPFRRRGPLHQMRDKDRQGQGQGIGQHVAGVGQQGQTAREKTADDLDDKKGHDDRQGHPQPPARDLRSSAPWSWSCPWLVVMLVHVRCVVRAAVLHSSFPLIRVRPSIGSPATGSTADDGRYGQRGRTRTGATAGSPCGSPCPPCAAYPPIACFFPCRDAPSGGLMGALMICGAHKRILI